MRLAVMSLALTFAAATSALAQDKPGAGQSTTPAAADATITVEMQDRDGNSVGTVSVRQMAHGTLFVADLENLPPGTVAFHVHERGACDAPEFESAGGHFNPAGKSHGFDNPDGYHAGDLPNLLVGEDGTARVEIHAPLLTLERQVASAGATAATGAGGGTAGGSSGDSAQDAAGGRPFAMLDDDGSAILIHAEADDYRSSPAGDAGTRIACGVIER